MVPRAGILPILGTNSHQCSTVASSYASLLKKYKSRCNTVIENVVYLPFCHSKTVTSTIFETIKLLLKICHIQLTPPEMNYVRKLALETSVLMELHTLHRQRVPKPVFTYIMENEHQQVSRAPRWAPF